MGLYFPLFLSPLPSLPPSLTDLPTVFKSFWGYFDVLAVDISALPLNCVVDTNFHSRLVATTVFPILFVCGIAVVWLIQRQRILSKGGDDLQASLSMLTSQSIRLCVMFLFTVFPMVAFLPTLASLLICGIYNCSSPETRFSNLFSPPTPPHPFMPIRIY